MRSDTPKVAHAILGESMVGYVVRAVNAIGCDPVVVVTGHGAQTVESLLEEMGGVASVRQDRQLGTGHAVSCAESALEDIGPTLLVVAGDCPLIRPETLDRLVSAREGRGASAAILTATLPDPTGYGRILRDEDGSLLQIVEQKDLEPGQDSIAEVNTSFYCFDSALLFEHIHAVTDENAQGEFYLTDVVGILRAEGHEVITVSTDEPEETLGVNSRVQLAEATSVMQRRINTAHMLAGVTMTDPELVWIGPDVALGRDVTIEPMTFLLGKTSVGDRVKLGPQTRATDSSIADGAVVDASVLVGASVGPGAAVGPNAYLRPGAVLEARAKAGAAVEIKNSRLGEGAKVPHLSYIGDADIGAGANVGAGTITCNYDGESKRKTKIGEGAFVGSDTMLVAPVEVGDGAVTGAGSTITRDVPPGALGIERGEQRVIEDYAARRRKRKNDEA